MSIVRRSIVAIASFPDFVVCVSAVRDVDPERMEVVTSMYSPVALDFATTEGWLFTNDGELRMSESLGQMVKQEGRGHTPSVSVPWHRWYPSVWRAS
jgi:hypothetical protein